MNTERNQKPKTSPPIKEKVLITSLLPEEIRADNRRPLETVPITNPSLILREESLDSRDGSLD